MDRQKAKDQETVKKTNRERGIMIDRQTDRRTERQTTD